MRTPDTNHPSSNSCSFTLILKGLERIRVVSVNELVQHNSARVVMDHNSYETLRKKNKSTLALICLVSQTLFLILWSPKLLKMDTAEVSEL